MGLILFVLDLLSRSQQIFALWARKRIYAVGLFLISMNIFLLCSQRIFLSTLEKRFPYSREKLIRGRLTLPYLGEHIWQSWITMNIFLLCGWTTFGFVERETSSQKLGRCASRVRSVWKSLGWLTFGSKKSGPKILAYLQHTFGSFLSQTSFLGQKSFRVKNIFWVKKVFG